MQAEPQNQDGKDMLADAFEQMGYQQENPGLRNSFLSGAYELRTGIPQGDSVKSSGPDVVRAMSTELWLNFLGIRMDSTKAEGLNYTINLVLPDIGEKFIVELENATLTNIEGFQSDAPDLTLTVNRSDLVTVMMGLSSFETLITDGKATVDRRCVDPDHAGGTDGGFRSAVRDHAGNCGCFDHGGVGQYA